MYVKIKEINVILDAVEDDMTGKELSLYLKGKLNPIAQFNPEQAPPVDETKAEEPVKKNNPYDFKPGSGGIIEMLQEIADDLRKEGHDIPPFPPMFGSFADFMNGVRSRHSGNGRQLMILRYFKDEAQKFVENPDIAQKTILHDFITKFNERYNGNPSDDLQKQVIDHIAKTIKDYRGSNKNLAIHIDLPPSIGDCPCNACRITPLN